ncbi:threonine/serine ThrE exporter family protein [Hungatella hathewayi]|nr:threonine/serine exporter family protein [Hungatella hathewayi]MBS4982604.1 threonine/serine exporter family protein [Hungatella hathewayi]
MGYQREVMEVAMQAGHILLENGAEIFRVEETIGRICRHFGVETVNVFIMSNGIIVTAGDEKEQYFAKVEHIPVRGSSLNRVAAVNQLSREIEENRYSIGEVKDCLDSIQQMPGKSKRMMTLAAGIGSAAFCYIYGGSLRDSFSSFLAGLVLYVFVLEISKPYMSKIVANICGGALVTLVSIVLYHVGVGENLNHMIIGSIIPLVPGVAFTNAIRDIADEDYISGSVRMLDAMLVFFCIAMGVGFVFTIYSRLGGIML